MKHKKVSAVNSIGWPDEAVKIRIYEIVVLKNLIKFAISLQLCYLEGFFNVDILPSVVPLEIKMLCH